MDENSTDLLSNLLLLGAFILVVIVLIAAPLVALSWSSQPFPGFVVEQTLVIADYGGTGWVGRSAGLAHPQRVTHLGEHPVSGPADFQAVVASLTPGDSLQVRTILPDGTQGSYPTVVLARFPEEDLIRLFWLPYGIGLAYLFIGAWIYRLRGPTRACRAFAFLSITIAIVSILFFDLISTHRVSALWTIAIAVAGSAFISMTMLFPQEWYIVQRWPWLRLLPYGISVFLGAWSLQVLNSGVDPWEYVNRWRVSYIYSAIGILFFLGTMFFRLRTGYAAVVRRQAQIILGGSFLAFVPFVIWFVAPMFGELIPFNPVVFMPFLLLFPLSIAAAILRYHLWDIDFIVRRTLTYSILSVLLVLLYFVIVIMLESIVTAFTSTSLGMGGGRPTTLLTVISTLAIAALFHPLRVRVQGFIDRRLYRSKYDAEQALAAFAATTRDEVDIQRLAGALMGVVEETVVPEHATLWLKPSADPQQRMQVFSQPMGAPWSRLPHE
jgi:hypothetical protein